MIRSVLAVLIVAGCASPGNLPAPTTSESLWASWCYQAHRGDPLRALKANACRMAGPSRYFRD